MENNSKQEILNWEKQHFDQIIGWVSEFDKESNIKTITFNYRIADNTKVQNKVFKTTL